MSEPTVGLLRAFAQRAVAVSSLRAVAEQVGITHRGLSLFLEGSKPRPSTLRKLNAWFNAHPPRANETPRELAKAAIEVLLSGIPAEHRDQATRALLADLVQLSEAAGVNPPPWVGELLRRD